MAMRADQDHLSHILLQKSLLSAAEFEIVQAQSALYQQTLFQFVMQYRTVGAEKLMLACREYFNTKNSNLNLAFFENIPWYKISFNIIKNNFILPVLINDKKCVLAIANPNDIDIVKTLSLQLKLSIEIIWIRYDILQRFHNSYISHIIYEQAKTNTHAVKVIVEHILSDAIHCAASDIHIEQYQRVFRVRFRLDGLLREIAQFPLHLADGILSCLKVLAQLDIAIKRMPQDGRFQFRSYLGFYKDCRISTCPTIFGEKMVIRLLDNNTDIRAIHELGLSENNQKIIIENIARPQGLILVTGPTGSGKTITLYTLLNLLNKHHRNIVTIEDPVEMQIDGINQTHVNTKTGLTFSHTLRALLRQDPDVIMIGEIRDHETAEMAIRAAQTGHLVLSTLHTNSAAEAIARLIHMGIAPFHLTSALTLVIAQRLVRKLCTYCHKGCAYCSDGFRGRTGIFELLPVDLVIQKLILSQASLSDINAQNKKLGNISLWESALIAINEGKTVLSEINRVIPIDCSINEDIYEKRA